MSPANAPIGTNRMPFTFLAALAKSMTPLLGSGTNVPAVPPATRRTSKMLRLMPVLTSRRLIVLSMRIGENASPPSDPERPGISNADCEPGGKLGRSASFVTNWYV